MIYSLHLESEIMQLPPNDRTVNAITTIRNQRVILDSDIAALLSLRSQIVTSNVGRGGRRYAPLCFTEQGVAMLSSVLKSPRAIAINVAIMRTFVRLRQIASVHAELARLFEVLEAKVETRLTAQDEAIVSTARTALTT